MKGEVMRRKRERGDVVLGQKRLRGCTYAFMRFCLDEHVNVAGWHRIRASVPRLRVLRLVRDVEMPWTAANRTNLINLST